MSAGSWQARVGWGPGSGQTPREGGARGSPGLPVHARSSAGSLSGFLRQMGRGVLFLPEPRLAHVGMYTLLPRSVTLCSPGLRVLVPCASGYRGRVTSGPGHTVRGGTGSQCREGTQAPPGSSLVLLPLG